MESPRLKLVVLPDVLAVSQLEPNSELPAWSASGAFSSVCRTSDEISIICASEAVPAESKVSRGWKAIKIEGPLDLDLVGILVSVAVPLAQAGIGILPVGTFGTDYILVRDRQLNEAVKALRSTGFHVEGF